MDKNLINLIIVVALVLISLIAVIAWIYWPELKAAHRWSQVQKAHRLEDQKIGKEKNSMLGSRSKSKNS